MACSFTALSPPNSFSTNEYTSSGSLSLGLLYECPLPDRNSVKRVTLTLNSAATLLNLLGADVSAILFTFCSKNYILLPV
jgi:hypothetical protein